MPKNHLSLASAKGVCTDAYSDKNLRSWIEADSKCEGAIKKLSNRKKRQFCLDANNDIKNILNSEVVRQVTMNYASKVIKRLCDTYAMTIAWEKCFPRRPQLPNSLLESPKKSNTKCKKALDALNDGLKQKFCLQYKDKVSHEVIKSVCSTFLSRLQANHECIVPYLDAMWYEISEGELKQIDARCRKAVKDLYGENKEVFCKEFPNKVPIGEPLNNEGIVDEEIMNRAVDVVKEACESTAASKNAMKVCIDDYLEDYFSASHEDLNVFASNCRTAVEAIAVTDKKDFCSKYNKKSADYLSSLGGRRALINSTPEILRYIDEVVIKEHCNQGRNKREIDNTMDEIKSFNKEMGITPETIASTQSNMQSKSESRPLSFRFFNIVPVEKNIDLILGIKAMISKP